MRSSVSLGRTCTSIVSPAVSGSAGAAAVDGAGSLASFGAAVRVPAVSAGSVVVLMVDPIDAASVGAAASTLSGTSADGSTDSEPRRSRSAAPGNSFSVSV